MALFHFRTCFALAYFRYFTTYKCIGLSPMPFLVTFFPTWEGGASVDVADLIGLNLVMSRNAGKGEYKIMVAALDWATAELIMTRGMPLWMSTDSNISLVHYIVASAQVWMITRYDLPLPWTFIHLCSLGSWTTLLTRVLVMGLLALSSSALYVNVHA
ncbi:hypothetical protein FD754_006192 [Muntiacus muntjak]|uniref:BOS complex subunit TMEM147 n=1 Tax=Muntiacus muntjak TaxID=9888 RepID=A0A5N3WP64_MUNMU|nr:hypothetical protein FD754_006192 [Muntiacus muntjak]